MVSGELCRVNAFKWFISHEMWYKFHIYHTFIIYHIYITFITIFKNCNEILILNKEKNQNENN